VLRDGSKPQGPETLRGSVHESPVLSRDNLDETIRRLTLIVAWHGAALPHALQTSHGRLHTWKIDLFASPGLCVVNSDPKRRKPFLELFRARLGSISRRKLGFQAAINFERVA